ncbi:MAG: ABC transporter ATP-binding protein [Phycisphaerae bacterium]
MPLVEIRDLIKRYRTPVGEIHTVLDVPRLVLEAREQVALSGVSGAGKTTLLHIVAGILRADSGTVRIADRELSSLSESQRDRHRAAHIGYVFQTFNLLQGYTAIENVLLGMMFAGVSDREWARQLLARVGLADRLHYRPRQLSVGQQQRVAVARALANRPRLVLADEPTGNLDPNSAQEAMALIRETCRENDAALLLVSHDPRALAQFERVEPLEQINRARQRGGEESESGA